MRFCVFFACCTAVKMVNNRCPFVSLTYMWWICFVIIKMWVFTKHWFCNSHPWWELKYVGALSLPKLLELCRLPVYLRQPELSYSWFRQMLKTSLFGRWDHKPVHFTQLAEIPELINLLLKWQDVCCYRWTLHTNVVTTTSVPAVCPSHHLFPFHGTYLRLIANDTLCVFCILLVLLV